MLQGSQKGRNHLLRADKLPVTVYQATNHGLMRNLTTGWLPLAMASAVAIPSECTLQSHAPGHVPCDRATMTKRISMQGGSGRWHGLILLY